jgi:hypothetical protein
MKRWQHFLHTGRLSKQMVTLLFHSNTTVRRNIGGALAALTPTIRYLPLRELALTVKSGISSVLGRTAQVIPVLIDVSEAGWLEQSTSTRSTELSGHGPR